MVGIASAGAGENSKSPDDVYGPLFTDAQLSHVFADQKTFPDCVPKEDPARIVSLYAASPKNKKPEELRLFIGEHFMLPVVQDVVARPRLSLENHLEDLWQLLERHPDEVAPGSSLIPLPYSYIVPGGRFREIYYWDSYFTMLGLREAGHEGVIESMLRNFAFLIDRVGFIPNGNRTYYLTRSQPPFFSLMVDLYAAKKGDPVYLEFLPSLQAEYDYWSDVSASTHHRITLDDGSSLSRYYDQRDVPRAESYSQDVELAENISEKKPGIFRHIRSAAESGWDFSTRWFADGKDMSTIITTDIIPVDLNCLLVHLEKSLARGYSLKGDTEKAGHFTELFEKRRDTLLKYSWNQEEKFFFDYNWRTKSQSRSWTLAGVTPLFLHLANPEQAAGVAENIRIRFLRPGGVVTTLQESTQQWDAPNGWAPLQWMTITGLENYGFHDLAKEIAARWIQLNRNVYERTGKLMEKYNVEDLSLKAGGGEYPSQDGFGWTNGVLLKLLRTYETPVGT